MTELIKDDPQQEASSSSSSRAKPKMVARTKSASIRAKQLFEQEQALKRQQSNNNEEDNTSTCTSSSSSNSSAYYSISSEERMEEVCAKSLMVLNNIQQQQHMCNNIENNKIIIDDDKSSNDKNSIQMSNINSYCDKNNGLKSSETVNHESVAILDAAELIKQSSSIEDDALTTLVTLKHKNDHAPTNLLLHNANKVVAQDCLTTTVVKEPIRCYTAVITAMPEQPNLKNTEIGSTQHLNLSPSSSQARSTTDLSDNTLQYSSSVDGLTNNQQVLTLLKTPPPQTTLPPIYQKFDCSHGPPITSREPHQHHQLYTVNSNPVLSQGHPESHYLNSYGSSVDSSTRRHSPQPFPHTSPRSSSSTPPPILPSIGVPTTYSNKHTLSSPSRYDPINNIMHSQTQALPLMYEHSSVQPKHYHTQPVYHYTQSYQPPPTHSITVTPPPPQITSTPPRTHHQSHHNSQHRVVPLIQSYPHHQTVTHGYSQPIPSHQYYQESSSIPAQSSYISTSVQPSSVNTHLYHQQYPPVITQTRSPTSQSPPHYDTRKNYPSQMIIQQDIQRTTTENNSKRKREYLKDIVSDTVKLGQLEYESFLAEQQRRNEGTTPPKKSKLFNMDFMNNINPDEIRDKIEVTKKREHYSDPAPQKTEYLEILQGIQPNAEYKFGDPLPNHVVKVTFGKYASTTQSASVKLSVFGRGLKDEPKERKFIQTIACSDLSSTNGAAKVIFSDLTARHASHKYGKMLYFRFTLVCDNVEVSSVETDGFTTITLRGIQKRHQRQHNRESNQ